MSNDNLLNYLKELLDNIPPDWLNLTTHRLDIYDEQRAKVQFLAEFEALFAARNSKLSALQQLPTAYDYIRLGHPLSCVLEWVIAKFNNLPANNVISFSSRTMPVHAVLRTNLLARKPTRILYSGDLPAIFEFETLERVYGYQFELQQTDLASELTPFDGSTIALNHQDDLLSITPHPAIDFYVTIHSRLGSVMLINGAQNEAYIPDIQHVRRRETIAMTPVNCHAALKMIAEGTTPNVTDPLRLAADQASVKASVQQVAGVKTQVVAGSSGLSIQYAIMMGLIQYAQENYPEKDIKFVVPPNCYGGTNDQARRVAACHPQVEIVDLPVDGGQSMEQSVETVLQQIALQDAIPFIIAEIPTNPRVEVPDLLKLKAALGKPRKTPTGSAAVPPVFILDQTFCPNVHFLGADKILSEVQAVAYASGSKFPSGGLCTAGYAIGNEKTMQIMEYIGQHLIFCDNEATDLQYEILAQQLPSMNQRIHDAYLNTREFVTFINETLPSAKINFVSEELASHGFTPSVFSLDLPTKGATPAAQERYKRALNLKLIDLMITQMPDQHKYCVSYGQLKGCYWTIPATSTQGTTKEGDKDYIVRVSLSANMDMQRLKEVFFDFIADI